MLVHAMNNAETPEYLLFSPYYVLPTLRFAVASQKELQSESRKMRLSLLLAAAVLAFTATRGQGHEVLGASVT